MRKILAFILLICVALTAFGCGSSSSESSAEESSSAESVENKDESSVSVEDSSESLESSDIVSEEASAEISETESSEEESSEDPSEEPEFDPMDYADSYVKLEGLDVYCVDDSAYKAFPAEYSKYEDEYWYNATVIFKATADIKNFRLLAYDESIVCVVDRALTTPKALKQGDMIIARMNVNDVTVNRGFSYKFNNKDIYYYMVEDMSGDSASQFGFVKFEPSAEKAYFVEWETTVDAGYYAFFDIDSDGVQEFIVYSGTCEADAAFTFYDFENGIVKYIGDASANSSSLVSDGTYLIISGGHMGYEWAHRVTISGGKIKLETLFDREVDFETGGYTEFPYSVKTYY